MTANVSRFTFVKIGLIGLAAVATTGLAAACAGGPTTSTVSAQVVQETFSAPVGSVVATSETGKTVRAAVGADGRFTLSLVEGSVYEIQLLADGLSVPLALNGKHGVYATGLAVTSGGAEADLGLVRMWDPTTATPYAAELPTSPNRSPDACESGYFTSTSEPCMADEATVACSDDGDSDSDSDDDVEQEGDHQDGDDDGEDVEGEDEDDGGQAIDGPVAIPSYSLGDGLGCDDEDEDSDSVEDDDDGV
ncbi:MAG: hypothetical protein RIF41_23780 [Polyangiaceae bacterium]